MNVAPALLLPLAVLLAPALAGAELPVNGVTIGLPVSVLARSLGPPADVASEDDGHRFVFAGGTTAYADDDGIVLAVDARSGSPRVEVDGMLRAFPIGTYSTSSADAELAGVAEFATPTQRSFRLAPRRDLVLGFGASSKRLERLTYGEPGQLARLGLLPGDAAAKAVAYRAPRLGGNPPVITPGSPGEPGSVVVYRVTIDRGGRVSGLAVAIDVGPPADDRARSQQIRAIRYRPATLDGRPIASTIFVEERR